ncbi:MAG: hypothetical protein EKK31_02915 [Hyphomicrobiales bacterium]|nr:MAG: hypothetical protein EKK31_02915 [Hyphomicrobiales bacterium]
MGKVTERIEGVVIGAFLGFGDEAPLVVFPGNPEETALPARSLCELTVDMIGCEVALLFQEGDPRKPLIVGRVVQPTRVKEATHVSRDGEHIKITGEKTIELRCGKSTIIMDEDGRITIRGTRIVSHASGSNRIRGGSIDLN